MKNKKHLFVDFDNKTIFDLNNECKGPECNNCNKFSKRDIRDLDAQKKIHDIIKDLPKGEKVAVVFSVVDELLQDEHVLTQTKMISSLINSLGLGD